MDYKSQEKLLKESFKNKRLAHSYILSGPREVNKKEFILNFIKFINCENLQNDSFCGKCMNCKKIDNNTFIDLKVLEDDLSIEQIRNVKKELIYPPYQADYRVIVVNNAEQLKDDAASVFLKTLEEPKKRNLFFLLTNNIFQVLPTIKSRCQVIKFNPLPRKNKDIKEYVFKDFLSGLKKKTLIEKFAFVKEREEEEYLTFLEEAIYFFQDKIFNDNFEGYTKKEIITILKNFKKAYFLLSKTNTNPRLILENTLINT